MAKVTAEEMRGRRSASALSRIFTSRTTTRRYLLFLLLIAPAFLLRIVTAAYPILRTGYLSLTNTNLITNTSDFIGLRNFPAVANDFGVQSALTFTVMLVVGATILEMILGMLVALLLNERFHGTTFGRTINLIPWAIPTVVAGYAFRWLLDDQFGLIPNWINQVAGIRPVVFISPVSARIVVILAHVWKDAPFMAFIFLAGLQGVPTGLYDAAKVDGANAWHRLWSVTVPLVAPLAITMGLFRLVWSLGSFDLVLGLTQGGPGVATSVLALEIFREGILFFKFGFASAISVVLLMLVGVIGVIGLWLFRKADVNY